MRNIIRKTFKYRCYPNEKTARQLYKVMKNGVTPIWNACVSEREQARKIYKERLNKAFYEKAQELKRDLTEKEEMAIRKDVAKKIKWPSHSSQYTKHVRKRDHREYEEFNSKMMDCTVAQVDGAEKSFRRKWIKGDKEARPPKQTELQRCITFRQSGWRPKNYEGGRLFLAGIGSVRVKFHRAIEGTIKTVSIIGKNRKWYVCFSVEIHKK